MKFTINLKLTTKHNTEERHMNCLQVLNESTGSHGQLGQPKYYRKQIIFNIFV